MGTRLHLRAANDRTLIGTPAGAAAECLDEECSVDYVDMLMTQLKSREQELSKTGRIVDYERDAALAGVRAMIRDLEGPVRRGVLG
jgi:hypothetical protein